MVLLFGCSFIGRAQDPLIAYPKNYSVVLDNSAVEVIRVHYGPHEKLGVHDHSKNPTIYVYLNDAGPVRFQHIEKEAFTLTRPPTTKGAFRISPGRLEEHTVENMGSTSSDFLRVELKQVPLGRFKQAFRGPAPRSISESRTSQEFKNPFVEVQRIVCLERNGCPVPPSESPSVIVSFNAADASSIRWLASSEGLTITGDRDAPAHLLRILISPAGK